MTYADTDDVAARLGQALSDAEITWATTLLADAEDQILGAIPDLAERLTADPPTARESAVVRAEAWAVVRVLRNPDGRYQETISGEYTYTRDRATSTGLLQVLPEEIDQILIQDATSSSAFMIRTDKPSVS